MTSEVKLGIILGTRPEIIKLAPLIHECSNRGTDNFLVHTGQHYSDPLDDVFFDQFELPVPKYNLEVGSGNHGEQTGAMLAGIERILYEEEPDVVVVQGDTNSTLAGALAASKFPTDLAHVEAGLRSFDKEMPEEQNRILTDHVSDYLFPPTVEASENLQAEGLEESSITVTGNTIVDAVEQYRKIAIQKSSILEELNLEPDGFLLLTAHRAENVDDASRFRQLLRSVNRFSSSVDMPTIYPIHPRARARLEESSITVPDRISLIDPLDFLDFLRLETEAALVFTDSGGVQEETCILRTPCITLRNTTERPETVDVGANRVVGVEPDSVVAAAREILREPTDWSVPFGNGDAAPRILDELTNASRIEVKR